MTCQGVINEEDDGIKAIKNEWGDEVYKSVVTALRELNEYNPAGRCPVPELWNFKAGRRATLSESVKFIPKTLEDKQEEENLKYCTQMIGTRLLLILPDLPLRVQNSY